MHRGVPIETTVKDRVDLRWHGKRTWFTEHRTEMVRKRLFHSLEGKHRVALDRVFEIHVSSPHISSIEIHDLPERGNPTFNRIRGTRRVSEDEIVETIPAPKEDNTMMKQRRLMWTLVFMAAMTLMNTGCAQQGSKVFSQDATKLSGTWVGASTTLNSRGQTSTKKTVTLVVDENGSIQGTARWTKYSGQGGHSHDKESDHDEEELIGSFNKDDGIFFLVETAETGFWHCKIIDANLINAHLIQSGKQYVSTFVEFTRLDESE